MWHWLWKRWVITIIFWTNPLNHPNSNVHGANMGPIWGRQNPDGPHVGPMNFAIWVHISLEFWFTALHGYLIVDHSLNHRFIILIVYLYRSIYPFYFKRKKYFQEKTCYWIIFIYHMSNIFVVLLLWCVEDIWWSILSFPYQIDPIMDS